MDIRQLRYFTAIAEQGSFSKASQTLHVSQPTLSKMVKQTEDELGVVLFDRSTRHIRLTDAGEALMVHASSIVKSVEQLQATLSDVVQSKRGSFSLGLPPVIGSSFFPDLIARFHRQFPGITIRLSEDGSKHIEQAIAEGALDVGVVVLPVDPGVFDHVPLVERALQLIVGSDHPLAGRQQAALRELEREPFILFRKGFALYDRVRDACIREGFEPHIAYESAQWDFISEMVAAGHGVSLLPETVCSKLDPERIAVIRKVEPRVPWNLGIVWRKSSYVSFAAREWIRFTSSSFRETWLSAYPGDL
ncbi:LysR family transcriptional regulator [Paenibacillus cymbidii]|uniref:LysR family transcriptional regulator n=1 Tax=Paenibacillus cymbidii TaxID=1639034 RepID=UPI001081E73D|nr:LysR family transcriptional regulator [Paenibacillus cymbidii]